MHQKMITTLVGVVLCSISYSAIVKADTSQEGTVIPYLAVGGAVDGLHSETLLVVGNPTHASTSGVIDVFDEDIQPLPIAFDGARSLQAEIPWRIPPGSASKFVLSHPGNSIQSGWLRVKPSGKSNLDLIVVVRVYYGRSLLSMQAFVLPAKGAVSSSIAWNTPPLPYRSLPSYVPAAVLTVDWATERTSRIRVKHVAKNIVPQCNEAKQFRSFIGFKEV
jgi:hypothetical protein